VWRLLVLTLYQCAFAVVCAGLIVLRYVPPSSDTSAVADRTRTHVPGTQRVSSQLANDPVAAAVFVMFVLSIGISVGLNEGVYWYGTVASVSTVTPHDRELLAVFGAMFFACCVYIHLRFKSQVGMAPDVYVVTAIDRAAECVCVQNAAGALRAGTGHVRQLLPHLAGAARARVCVCVCVRCTCQC
jgi:hypothetical protein